MCQLIGLVDFDFECSLTDIMLQLTNVEQTSELDHGEPKEWWLFRVKLIKIKRASLLADEVEQSDIRH